MRTPVPGRHATRPLYHRQSVSRLTEEELSRLREAYSAAIEIQDERGFNYHAGIHGLPLPVYCRHGRPGIRDPLFLPWHRAYLYFFELALRDLIPSVTLPWWDWSSEAARTSGILGAYTTERVEDTSNPLYSVPIPESVQQQGTALGIQQPPTETFRRPRDPFELPTPAFVEEVLSSPNFLDFSDRLEDVHNWIHVWIGGTTAEVPWAAYDPLFWAHHAMVDRLWRLWQLRNPETNLDPGLLREPLPPFNLTVEDTLDVTALGYKYASSVRRVISGGS